MKAVLLTIGAMVASTAPAHAMGSYVELDVVAWNADGSAAILTRSMTSSGTVGRDRELIVVTAGQPKPVVMSFDSTADGDTEHQRITLAQCQANAAALAKIVKAQHFADVAVDKAHCASDRVVFTIGNVQQKLVAASLETDEDIETFSAKKLTIVLSGRNGDESPRAHGSAMLADGEEFLSDDLRRVR